MTSGIEVFDAAGNLLMDGTGRYCRIIEVVNPFSLGVPGSRSYPDIDPQALEFIYFQGGSRVLTVSRSGRTISWSFGDSFSWPELGNTPRLVVFIK